MKCKKAAQIHLPYQQTDTVERKKKYASSQLENGTEQVVVYE